MSILSAALLAFPATGIGAPFPHATVVAPPQYTSTSDAKSQRKECFVRYRLKTVEPIAAVAKFYGDVAKGAGATLLDDSAGRFKDYRTLAYGEPHFLFVVIDHDSGPTMVSVVYKTTATCG